MQIKLEPHPERKHLWSILINDDHWRSIHGAVFGYKPKLTFTGQALNEFQQWFMDEEYRLALTYAFKRLMSKSYLSEALAKLMRERCVSSATIDKVLRECRRLGYLDDSNWIKHFIAQCTAKRMGPQMISAKLYAKGVSQEKAAQAIEQAEIDQVQVISKLLQTKYRNKSLQDHKEKQKIIGSLLRKGFSFEDVKEALSQQ